MPSLNKQALAAAVAAELDTTKKVAEAHLQTALDLIMETLSKGENVDLYGFGNFKAVQRAERKGTNPKTKEAIVIPAHKVVTFKPSKAFKELVK